jgi:hypothetical protein
MGHELPDIEQVAKAYALSDQGMYPGAIGKQLGVSRSAVRHWLDNPDRFSPVIDDVAIRRALEGDRTVFQNLTAFETKIFWEKSVAVSDATEMEYRPTPTGAVHYNPRKEFIAYCLGMSTEAIDKAHSRTRARVSN